ncbi:hypothetical protein FRC08_006867 [Ceratobasidium sp. 394]|nr:hypothetical protein FRC08_006867 [Ceratobasidium sp. 394]
MSARSPAKKKQKYVPDPPARPSTNLYGTTPTHRASPARSQSLPRVDAGNSPVQATRARAMSLYPTPSDSGRKSSASRGTLELYSPPVPAPNFTPDGARRISLDGIQDPPSDVSDDDNQLARGAGSRFADSFTRLAWATSESIDCLNLSPLRKRLHQFMSRLETIFGHQGPATRRTQGA